jgi:hypothetical protein
MGGISGVDQGQAKGLPRSNLDFDLHPGICKASGNHRSGGPDVPEVPAKNRPAGLEILDFRQDVAHPNDIRETTSSLGQGSFDVPHALLRLLDHIAGDGHRPIVESGRAGHKYQVAVNYGAGISNVSFE